MGLVGFDCWLRRNSGKSKRAKRFWPCCVYSIFNRVLRVHREMECDGGNWPKRLVKKAFPLLQLVLSLIR